MYKKRKRKLPTLNCKSIKMCNWRSPEDGGGTPKHVAT